MIGITRLSFLAVVEGDSRKPQSELGVPSFESKLAYNELGAPCDYPGLTSGAFCCRSLTASLQALIPTMRNRKIPFRFFVRASLRRRTFSAAGMDDISDRRGLRGGR